MTTRNHFYCPACRKADCIEVETTSKLRVTSEGERDWHCDDNGDDHQWSAASQTYCLDCGHAGPWATFQHEASAVSAHKAVAKAARIVTGGLEFLSDGQLGTLTGDVEIALRLSRNLVIDGGVAELRQKWGALKGEVVRRGLSR
jgi:hypothetical protein